MQEFRFEHKFYGRRDHYWEIFFDRQSSIDQLESGNISDYEFLELDTSGPIWRRVIRATPSRDLPAIIRKVTGASLGYTETTTFDPAQGIATTTVVTTSLAKRIHFSGTHSLLPTDDHHFRRIFAGTVEVRMALIGKKIETAILDDMTASYARGAEMTQAKLKTWPTT